MAQEKTANQALTDLLDQADLHNKAAMSALSDLRAGLGVSPVGPAAGRAAEAGNTACDSGCDGGCGSGLSQLQDAVSQMRASRVASALGAKVAPAAPAVPAEAAGAATK